MSKKEVNIEPEDICSEYWLQQPLLIKEFIEKQPDNEQLGQEIAYILKTRLKRDRIAVASITTRAKTLNSFLEKCTRKKYTAPMEDIEDLAGVRVVCLYAGDLGIVENIISDELDVINREDKIADKKVDAFGYNGIHLIVRLGKKNAGTRYAHLQTLKCEIQIRTVLQDAWAIIDHHLVYKKESDIPEVIQRKLNRLAASFETADEQFDLIRKEREQYIDALSVATKNNTLLQTQLNYDSFLAYLRHKFSGARQITATGKLIYDCLDKGKYSTLLEIDRAINQVYPISTDTQTRMHSRYPITFVFAALLCKVDKDFRKKLSMPPEIARGVYEELGIE